MIKLLKHPTTDPERLKQSRSKDRKYNSLLREIAYKDEGELFLIALKNSSITRLKRSDYYKVELIK